MYDDLHAEVLILGNEERRFCSALCWEAKSSLTSQVSEVYTRLLEYLGKNRLCDLRLEVFQSLLFLMRMTTKKESLEKQLSVYPLQIFWQIQMLFRPTSYTRSNSSMKRR